MLMSQNVQNHKIKSFYFRVSGRVQGVFFRVATKNMADQYNLKGWVRNLSNGDVEGVVVGDVMRINNFLDWVKEGPKNAKVLRFNCKEVTVEEFGNFDIR